MSRAQQFHGSHASAFSYHQSKPSLLAGVQDAYWSDDEEENSTCPLCIKELDLEEQSFKPCPCGYQICLFCWHHIRDNMNARCPACRREYTEEAVVWKPVAAEDSKRVQQQKRRKEKERKDLETLGRKSYLDVRIVQRNVVYVVGLGPRYAKEETIAVLRSSDYFGRYGKISRIQLQKRTPPGVETPVVGVYITYVRREDAERAMQAIDGSPSPSGGGEVMRASFGTAKYCVSFLRSVSCTNNNCLDAHEWGEPDDCFTREELATLKHTIKDTEKVKVSSSKRVGSADAPTLPRTAAWATRTVPAPSNSGQTIQLGPPGPVLRAPRTARQPRNAGGKQPTNDTRDKDKRRVIATLPATAAPRPLSPTPQSISKSPGLSAPTASSQVPPPAEPVPSTAPSSPQLTSSVAPSEPVSVVTSPQSSNAQVSVPPGLSAPPGLALPSVKPAASIGDLASPKPPVAPVPLHPPPGLIRLPPGLNIGGDQTSPIEPRPYQLSKHAQALIDDVRMRREAVMATATPPPIFPDFDRTLANLMNSAGFSFSFANVVPPSSDPGLPSLRTTRKTAFDPFASPLDRASTSAGSSPALRSIAMDQRRGSFSPFDDAVAGEGNGRSRFDFARRQASLGATRDASSYGQPSRGTTPFLPEATTSGNTLYNSSDAGYISRQQGSWNSYQSNGSSSVNNDFRYQSGASASGSQFQSPLTQGHPDHAAYGDMPPNPFDQAPIAENMRELVRGFETPAIEAATARQLELGGQPNFLGLPHTRPVPPYTMGLPQHGQAFPYQMHAESRGQGQPNTPQQRLAREDAVSQRMNMGSPADGSVYSYQHQQPPNTSMPPSHQQNLPLGAASNVSKELTSPNVTYAAPATQAALPSPAGPVSSTPASTTIASVPEMPESPRAQLASSDNQEEFPALPTAAIETTTRPTPTQPPVMPKPPPAPPVTRKASASAKVVKVEPAAKKPTLPPLTTAAIAKSGQSTEQSPLIELVSAKAEIKGKKPGNESASLSTPITPSVQPSAPTKTGKHSEPASASGPKPSAAKWKESKTPATPTATNTQASAPGPAPEPVEHAPILARQTKKSKPQQLPKKKPVVVREEPAGPKENTPEPQATASPARVEPSTVPSALALSTNLGELLGQLRDQMDIRSLKFFEESSLPPKDVSEYKPLMEPVALLSAVRQHYLFHDEAPDGIEDGLIAFERLLTTVTKMISDLLKLMPRKTRLDRAMWEIVKKEMTKAGFMTSNHTLKDWSAAVQAEEHLDLEAKIEWLEANLAGLERYHNDINQAYTTEFLASNDRGRGCTQYLPRVGDTCERYKMTGLIVRDGEEVEMNVAQLEVELAAARKEICSVSEELHEVLRSNARLVPELA